MDNTVTQKQALFQKIAAKLQEQGFTVANEDQSRPWGGFFVIEEDQAQHHVHVVAGVDVGTQAVGGIPKTLVQIVQKLLVFLFHCGAPVSDTGKFSVTNLF